MCKEIVCVEVRFPFENGINAETYLFNILEAASGIAKLMKRNERAACTCRLSNLQRVLTLERPGGGGGGGESNGPPPSVFTTLNLELSSSQNETFSTCSPIISASFDVNWMTSSLVIHAKLMMQINV